MSDPGGGDEIAQGNAKRASRLSLLVKLFLYGFVAMLLVCIAAALAAYLAYEHVTQPGVPGELVEFQVPEGATGTAIGGLLANAELIEHEYFFRLAIRLEDSGKPIKHGTYRLYNGHSPAQLLLALQEGPDYRLDRASIADELKVTVPEGLTIAQAAQLFERPEAFVEAASDPELIARLGIDVSTLEGFLMPNTYYFAKEPTEREVVERMLAQFEEDFAGLLEKYGDSDTLDKLQRVTVASLVEEESRVDEERPLVAAVIYNRLARNRPLEMDSTLQYALGKYGQRLLSEDKQVDSPYNTYRNQGLPPGPISSPGVASLEAALAPADTDYLYFVSNADGKTHTFSRTLREHNRAVARYRKEASKQRREQRRANRESQ